MGSEFGNNSAIFWPEITVICRASSLPGNTVRLTRESSGNKVNWLEVVLSAISDIFVSPHVRPVFSEHLLAENVIFNLPLTRHSSPLQP